MSYYHPSTPHHLAENGPNPFFSIVPFELIIEDVKEPLLVFDFPSDIVIYLDDIEIPSRTFDYFNPLIVDPIGLGIDMPVNPRYGRLLFYREGEPGPINRFFCHRFVIGRPEMIIPLLESSIYYPPSFCINYETLTVSRSMKARQLCDLLPNLNESRPQLARTLNQFFQAMIQAQLGEVTTLSNEDGSVSMILPVQQDDSDDDEYDYDEDDGTD